MKIRSQDRPKTTGITRDPTHENPGARQQEHLNILIQDKPSTAEI